MGVRLVTCTVRSFGDLRNIMWDTSSIIKRVRV